MRLPYGIFLCSVWIETLTFRTTWVDFLNFGPAFGVEEGPYPARPAIVVLA